MSSKRNDIRVLGLSNELKAHLDLTTLRNKPYNVDVNFGTINPSILPGETIRLNPGPSVALTRTRPALSKVLSIEKLPTFKCRYIQEFYEDEVFNMLKFREEFNVPCIIAGNGKSKRINHYPGLIDSLLHENAPALTIEQCLDFHQVFMINISPLLAGTLHTYSTPVPISNQNGVIFSSCMPRDDFFNRKINESFTDIKYSNFIKPRAWTSIIDDSLRAVNQIGLDFAEVDIAYNQVTSLWTILDVKTHIKFDNARRIGLAYSSCIEKMCDIKYARRFEIE